MVFAIRGSRVVFACTAKIIYMLYSSFLNHDANVKKLMQTVFKVLFIFLSPQGKKDKGMVCLIKHSMEHFSTLIFRFQFI